MEVTAIIQLVTNGSIGAVVLFLFMVVNRQWQSMHEKQKKQNDKLQDIVIELVQRATMTNEKMTHSLDKLTIATEKQTKNLNKLFEQTTKVLKK
jgi:uncharacterized membrane protein